MKYLFIMLLAVPFNCACASATHIPDYQEVHKPYLAMTCLDSKTQQEMDACTQKSLNLRTRHMKMILGQLMKNYKAGEAGMAKALEKSQHSWQVYKNNNCKLETYDSRSGSGYASILNACLETKTNERISYLQWLLDNP